MIKKIKYVSSYVMQEEVFIGSLSVRECIEYAAALNIKSDKS